MKTNEAFYPSAKGQMCLEYKLTFRQRHECKMIYSCTAKCWMPKWSNLYKSLSNLRKLKGTILAHVTDDNRIRLFEKCNFN